MTSIQHLDQVPFLVTAPQAARLCGWSVVSWKDRVRTGLAPLPVNGPGKKLWRAEELRAWASAGCPTMADWAWPLAVGGAA